MEDREFLTGGEPENNAVALILGKHPPESLPEDAPPSVGTIAMNELEHGDSVAMAFPDLDQEASLGLVERRKPLLDRDGSQGHDPGITSR